MACDCADHTSSSRRLSLHLGSDSLPLPRVIVMRGWELQATAYHPALSTNCPAGTQGNNHHACNPQAAGRQARWGPEPLSGRRADLTWQQRALLSVDAVFPHWFRFSLIFFFHPMKPLLKSISYKTCLFQLIQRYCMLCRLTHSPIASFPLGTSSGLSGSLGWL